MSSSTAAGATGSLRAARRGLTTYLAVVVLLSAPLEAGIIATHAFEDTARSIAWLAALMSVPTIASVVARVWLREGFADLGFRQGHDVGRAIAIALALPVVVGTVVYGLAWSTGLVGVRLLPVGTWAALLLALLALNLVLSTTEELGWRGYMLPHMVAAGVPAPIAVSSLVWGLWHVPLFLWGGFVHDGPSPVVTTSLLLVTTSALGYVLGRLRLDTGNVWPAALLHVAWNTVIQSGFDPAATGGDKALWVGENGVLTLLVLIGVALLHRRLAGPPRGDQPRPRPGHRSSPPRARGTAPARVDS